MARSLDVKLVACTTSLGIMGIRPEELLDNIEYGGVATYLGRARESGVNLFI
jgi:peroxiredoxin family protein